MNAFDEQIRRYILDISFAESEISRQKANKREADVIINERELAIEYTKDKIIQLMRDNGVMKTQTDFQSVIITHSPKKVIITNEATLPDEVMRIKKEPDKVAIRKLIEGGISIEGAMLSNGGETLLIRKKS